MEGELDPIDHVFVIGINCRFRINILQDFNVVVLKEVCAPFSNLDEVALQRSQSIGTKAMKAALRGKRKADKEREALISAEGIDSIATIAEQLEAEVIEGKLEGGNKDAEK